MNRQNNLKTLALPVYLQAFYILALACLICFVLRLGASLLIPLILAALLSMLLAPVTIWLEKKHLVGVIKVSSILAVLNSTALLLIGVEHAIFFGVFAAMLNIVPFFGPFFGAILPVLYVFLTRDGLFYPLAVIAAFTTIQFLESYLLTPKIIGTNVHLNPLAIFIGLLAGALIWGVVGMIIVIPILSITMQLFKLSVETKPFAFLLGPPEKNPSRNEQNSANSK